MAARILVVDDEPLFSHNVGSMLRRAGLEPCVVSCADEALEFLDAQAFHAVCLDINLPDGHGLDLLERVRRAQPDLPVVVMSGEDSDINRVRAELLDAAAFLVKPFPLRELRDIVTGLTAGVVSAPPPARRAPVVMMYSHDGYGLGHLRRNLNIATRFVAEEPEASVLMLVGSPSAELMEMPNGVDMLKLPSIVKVGTNDWRPQGLQLSPDTARELRSRVILRTAQSLRPDLFLVDHVPAGVWGELLPTLRMLRSLPNPPRVVLGLRDVLDAPSTVREAWRKDGLYDVVSELYDEVFIYGEQRLYDSGRRYALDSLRDCAVHYCGYVCGEDVPRRAAEVRAELGASEEPLVLVTGGGGRDAFPMMRASLDALQALDARLRPRMALITGPLMDADERDALAERARDLPARVLTAVRGTVDYLAAADLVITMGGYNTLQEALRLGKRVVVVPRRGPSAEQRTRARILARLGLVTHVDPDTLCGERLVEAIVGAIDGSMHAPETLARNGAAEAVARMRALIASVSPPRRDSLREAV